MATVTFPPALGGSGLPYSDDGTAARDMRDGGHRQWLLPMVGEAITATGAAATQATAAANSTLGSANVQATSTTALTVGTGARTLTVQAGRAFLAGMPVRIALQAAPTTFMDGTVSAYTAGTGAMTVQVASTSGAATGAQPWNVMMIGQGSLPSPAGNGGRVLRADAAGSAIVFSDGLPLAPQSARAAAYTVAAADAGRALAFTGAANATWTLPAPVAAGNGFLLAVVSAATAGAVLTLAPASGLIEGMASIRVYPGERLWVLSDGATWQAIGRAREVALARTVVAAPVATVTFEAPFADTELREVRLEAQEVSVSNNQLIARIRRAGAYGAPVSQLVWTGNNQATPPTTAAVAWGAGAGPQNGHLLLRGLRGGRPYGEAHMAWPANNEGASQYRSHFSTWDVGTSAPQNAEGIQVAINGVGNITAGTFTLYGTRA